MYIRRGDSNHSLGGESRSIEICIILSIFCALSTTGVALRSYIRLVLLRTFGFDDAAIILAQVLAIGAAVAIGLETKYGLGFHTWAQPAEYFIPYMKAFYSSVVVYNVAMCPVKISILLQYRRVFAVRMVQLITFYGVVFMSAWTVTLCFLLTLICVPVSKFWDSTIPGRCLDSLTIWYMLAGFNLVTDLAIFCLPLPVIQSLQLPRKQKIMLIAVFGLGLFTCIISIIRIRTLKIAAATDDPNWDNVDAAIWSFLEVSTAIIAACLPTLRPIFSKIMPRLFSSSIGQSQGPSQYRVYVQAPSNSFIANPNSANIRNTTVGKSDSKRSLQESDNIELPPHNSGTIPPQDGCRIGVSITGGEKQGQYPSGAESQWSEVDMVIGGIQTTTAIMQQVTVKTAK
ncbi:hypothetical protein EDB81DRAFT_831440 [Dactylonectria macrodidyma]|uniref:Rhodopsin domain-containing protein n=1 Tax=Dactylonectria macrodidyma TaxID=307937 RepID=A0A9P9D1D8_9HYPO|nr:hypothetical protein EDB81DRAFT_831440 [Dactylonectria macrodidyma]